MRRTHKRRNRSQHHRPNRDMTVYPCEGVGAAEHARIQQRMELYDSLSDEEAALVQENMGCGWAWRLLDSSTGIGLPPAPIASHVLSAYRRFARKGLVNSLRRFSCL